MPDTTIKLDVNTKFNPIRMVTSVSIQVGVIGIGIFAESPAMQWSGFVVLVILVIAVAFQSAKKDEGLTINQARKRLDELEAKS